MPFAGPATMLNVSASPSGSVPRRKPGAGRFGSAWMVKSSTVGACSSSTSPVATPASSPSSPLEQRKAAYSALQVQLAAGTYLLPLAFRDVVFAASDRLTGPSARTLADPADRFWDVLTWRLAVDR